MPPPRNLKENLKGRIAETLDDVNPLIVWHLRRALHPVVGLSIFATLAIIGGIVCLLEPGTVAESRNAIELLTWIYVIFFSICFIACCSPGVSIASDELMGKMKGLTPLEEFHGELLLVLIPTFVFWAVNTVFAVLFILLIAPYGELIFAVTVPALFFAATAFGLGAGNVCYFKGCLDFSIFSLAAFPGLIALLAVLGQLVVCAVTGRGYYTSMISLLFLLPICCVIYYRLGRYQLTYNYYRPLHGALLQLLVSSGTATVVGIWVFVLNYWLIPVFDVP